MGENFDDGENRMDESGFNFEADQPATPTR